MLEFNKIYNGDCRELLDRLDDESIDMVVTSPPYYMLRDYGTNPVCFGDGEYQLGLEPTFDLYIEHLCDIFDKVRRVLKPYGSVWVNIGDTYAGGTPGAGSNTGKHKVEDGDEWASGTRFKVEKPDWQLPDGCLCGVPWRFAIEMCNRGWTLRNDLVWNKPNGMPDSAKSRFTVIHEYIFFFTKHNREYYFEQQFEPHKQIDRRSVDKHGRRIAGRTVYFKGEYQRGAYLGQGIHGKNKRSVWSVLTRPSGVKHYATYPEELIETPINAACPKDICNECGKPREKIYKSRKSADKKIARDDGTGVPHTSWNNNPRGHMGTPIKDLIEYTKCDCNAGFHPGVVLDPFAGIGTTLITAWKLERNYIGFELSPEFYEIAKRRVKKATSNTRITDFMEDDDDPTIDDYFGE